MVNDLIESGEFKEALEYLTDLNDETIRYQRLVCLNALGDYKQARSEAAFAKANAKETYYDVIAIYLNVLKELEEFEEAINILIEELSMPYIPYQYESLFNAAYDEILLAKQEANYTLEAKNQIFSVDEIAVLLDKEECNDDLLYMALDQLQQLNVRMIIPAIERFLLNPKKHSFAKSIIMETLIEQQIDDEMQVFKNGVIYDFNPAYLPLVLSQNAYEGIYRLLERELEDENPSLLALCQEYLEYVLYSYFPKEIYDDEYAVYAAGIQYYLSLLQSIEISMEDLEIAYGVDESEIEEIILALKQIEC
ncbi:MAG: hypothetical protein U0L85_03620 [Bacilli bacterium]|nr:hypothetical protein [Bacilli bacterium]